MLTAVGIGFILVLTAWLLKKQINIGAIMLTDSILLLIVQNIPFNKGIQAFVKGGFSDKTISLIILLYLIMVLEKTMRTTGMISEISENLKYMFRSNRIAAALLPMVIGMLPSPGGARLSCPMVEEAISEEPDDRIRAFVNYWFRHVWRDAFILYPGFIVATGFLEIPAIVYFFRIMPFMILAAIIGIFLGIVHVKKEELDNSVEHNIIVKRFMLAFSPIVFLVLLYLGLAALGIGDFGLQISCLITVLLLLKWKKIDLKQTREILKQSFSVNILLIVFGIMIFKEALFVSGILDPLTSIMGKYNISRYALFMALPFIGGFSTGIMVSAISLSFPILLPLGLGEEPIFGVVAFISAMSGLMVSPVHLCAVMSADYFSVPLSRVLKRTIIGETIIIAVAIISLILLK